MQNISNIIVSSDCTVKVALERLQGSAMGILLLVDREGRLLRTVTDGDLRRLLLAGSMLEDYLNALPDQSPTLVVEPIGGQQALSVMLEHQVDQLPVVDIEGKPVDVLLRRDLDCQVLLSTPHLGVNEMHYVEDAFRTNWVAPLGPNVDAFENELADYVGVGYAAALSSGTAAIHLALRLFNVDVGDTVFCSSLTFVASANPILYQGATPVFIDSEPESWNMSPAALERAFKDAEHRGKFPRAVLVVNLYGQSADFDPILEICNRYDVPVIEDAAESLGATYKGKHSGTLGRLGIYSFNGNKIITTSGGGMLVSDERELIDRARFLATQAREQAAHYEHVEIGYNYRMSNVLAGIGRGQVRVLDERVEARRAIFSRYASALKNYSEVHWMPEPTFGRSTHWLSACLLNGKLGTTELIEALAAERIEARRVWKPMHMQKLFDKCLYYPHAEGEDISAYIFERGVCLPSGSNMNEAQQARIILELKRALKRVDVKEDSVKVDTCLDR